MRLSLGNCLIAAAAVSAGLCRGLDDGGGLSTRTGNDSNAISELADAMKAKNLTDTACDRPRRDRSAKYTVMSIVLGSVTCVVVGIRMVFKYSRGRIGIDDWIILSSLAVGIPCTALNVQGLSRHGIGKDVWTLRAETVTDFVLFFYLLEIFYVSMIAMIKIAMCFFYLSIFPGTRIRQVLWVTAVVNVIIGIASVLTAIFQCSPVRFYWNMYVTPEAGTCIDIHVLAWVHGGINIAMNFWLIAIPLSQVRGLDLHWKKKTGVIIMFLTGAFDTIVSILRLQSLIHFAISWNPTWEQWSVAWWSTIEIDIGLICTCLPTLRLILMRIAPRVFGTSRGPSRGTPADTKVSRGIIVQKQVHISSVDGSVGTEAMSQTRCEPWEVTSEGGGRHHSEACSSPHPQW
ncbi:hypothetical protein HRG_006435 [Hirsutella rhossiliensis]|uniref:Rhodopsin domain-containing protein n=1 Tax=Hirsutella rhossiliensis TaxID=111463 RepID=A0A9P8MUF1_9HYPO|nr:uncharacterized protein HRG_06435 [Hirsutella rhossiliensis]KAH0962333.1 hypothetical protein HRG_06435 [Hirsutella rhossiliensis]